MIIKNVMVSRDDLSPYMKEVAEENDYLKKPRKTLINSYLRLNHAVSSAKILSGSGIGCQSKKRIH